ncbi:hypothetical protein OIV83_003207 [Microbotryomycetes sp. JL201]|nr:hypothetical protein OIV83_003207 [Microbotryomycetes sp. JL201]
MSTNGAPHAGANLKPIRIAGCSGSAADRRHALARLANNPDQVDAIMGDWLSEYNMTLRGVDKLNGAECAWEPSFIESLEPALEGLAKTGIKLIANAGASDTMGLADTVTKLIAEKGLSLRVAWVEGDEVFDQVKQLISERGGESFRSLTTDETLATWKHTPIYAQCYMGCFGIVEALLGGADIVICGRVADASPVIGLAAWWHKWKRTDFQSLAGAFVAGHLIECSNYATGGNFSGFKALGEACIDIGYPIAEIEADGTHIITMERGTDGFVSPSTLTAQLVYEIQGPLYYNSDVVAELSNIQFREVGKNRVRVTGFRGRPPPATTKVSLTALGGYQAEASWYLVGLDIHEKARVMERQIRAHIDESKFSLLKFFLNGTAGINPYSQDAATVEFRIFAQAREPQSFMPHVFFRVTMDQMMQVPPGVTLNLDVRKAAPKPFYELFTTVMPQASVRHRAHLPDGKIVNVPAPTVTEEFVFVQESYEPSDPVDLSRFGPTRAAPLGLVVHARSGDKGSDANVGFFVRNDDEWPWLLSLMTTAKVKSLLGKDYKGGRVDRFELPHLRAVHFLLKDHLDRGVGATSTYDFLGKNVAEYLRCKHVEKCDGAASKGLACRRCQVYNIECDYDGVPVPPRAAASTSSGTSSASSNNTPRNIVSQPPSSSNHAAPSFMYSSRPNGHGTGAINMPNFFPAAATASTAPPQTDSAVAQALREITDRLRHIEADLAVIKGATSASGSARGPSQSTPGDYSSPDGSSYHAPHQTDLPADTHPLQVLEHTVDQIERLQVHSQSPEWQADTEHAHQSELGAIEPDAIVRGLVSVADAEAAFAFFFERIHPWLPVVCDTVYREPLVAQAKSPFLFHVILLITNFYNTSNQPRAQEVYRGLTEIVNLRLSWQILAAELSKINPDFIRGMLVLIYYKPVQHVAFWSRGVESISRMVHLSKVNALSSFMIHSFIHRCADLIGMHRAPDRFLSAAGDPSILQNALADLRVYFWLHVADLHGSLQSGRPVSNDVSYALKATRPFAELRNKACDVRSAAALEIYAVATTPKNVDPSKVRLDNLAKINENIDAWHRYWEPRLADAQRTVDPLAYATVQNMSTFVEFTANGAIFTRWFAERSASIAAGGNGRPPLSNEDWLCLGRAVRAAQQTVFSTSKEAAADNSPLRTAPWPNPNPQGGYEPLNVDPTVVDNFRTALDTMTCITFISSLILLVRLCSSGLVSCNFELRRAEYEAGAPLAVPPTANPNHKMRRLLELGATFLYAVAPNKLHPARKHALVAQMILRAGFSEAANAAAAEQAMSGLQNLSKATSPIHALNQSPLSSHSAPSPSGGLSATATLPAHSQGNTWPTSLASVTMPSLSMSEDRSAIIIGASPSASMTVTDAPTTDLNGNSLFNGDMQEGAFGQSPPTSALASVLQYFSAEQNLIPGMPDPAGFMSMLDDFEDTVDWQAMNQSA